MKFCVIFEKTFLGVWVDGCCWLSLPNEITILSVSYLSHFDVKENDILGATVIRCIMASNLH